MQLIVRALCLTIALAGSASSARAERPPPDWLHGGDVERAPRRTRREEMELRSGVMRALAIEAGRACRRGDLERCHEAAAHEQRPERRRALLARACRGDVWLACEALGRHFMEQGANGRAVPWLARACRGGVASACAELVSFYRNGEGVIRSERRAARWERRLCEIDPALCAPTPTP